MNCIFLTKKQICERFGFSISTIDRLRKSGKLPYRKIFNSVRFVEEDIEKFITNSLASEWRSNNHKGGKNE